jgi:hypothetical protein
MLDIVWGKLRGSVVAGGYVLSGRMAPSLPSGYETSMD